MTNASRDNNCWFSKMLKEYRGAKMLYHATHKFTNNLMDDTLRDGKSESNIYRLTKVLKFPKRN